MARLRCAKTAFQEKTGNGPPSLRQNSLPGKENGALPQDLSRAQHGRKIEA